MTTEVDRARIAFENAADLLARLIVDHGEAAIPSLLAQCVAWCVDHGNGNQIRESLKRAIKLSQELELKRYPDTGWAPIPGWEGFYDAHPEGHIRSVSRTILNGGIPRKIRCRVLTPSTTSTTGYPTVTLHRDNRHETKLVHHLIAETFIGPRPPGLLVCHRDGNRLNGRDTNLYYGSHKENGADSIRHGVLPRGESSVQSKLTEDDVRYIRANPDRKPQRELAAMFNLHPKYISRVIRGEYWKHVPGSNVTGRGRPPKAQTGIA